MTGVLDRGLIVAEGYDYEIIEKMNHPHDDYSNSRDTLKADGNVEKTVSRKCGRVSDCQHRKCI